jgi:hypothetical protein
MGSGPSLLDEKSGQLWWMRKGQRLWAVGWRSMRWLGGCGWPGEGDRGWGEQEQEQRVKWGETVEREKDPLREWEGLMMAVGGCERRRRWWNGRRLFFYFFKRGGVAAKEEKRV